MSQVRRGIDAQGVVHVVYPPSGSGSGSSSDAPTTNGMAAVSSIANGCPLGGSASRAAFASALSTSAAKLDGASLVDGGGPSGYGNSETDDDGNGDNNDEDDGDGSGGEGDAAERVAEHSNSPSFAVAAPDPIVNGTIMWYRYNPKKEWEWPAVLFESWAALRSWGLPVPSKISSQSTRFDVGVPRKKGGGRNEGDADKLPPLPSGCVGIAFFCGRRCEYGLVRDAARLRHMQITDAAPKNAGMSARAAADFAFALEEARELMASNEHPEAHPEEADSGGGGGGGGGGGRAKGGQKRQVSEKVDDASPHGHLAALSHTGTTVGSSKLAPVTRAAEQGPSRCVGRAWCTANAKRHPSERRWRLTSVPRCKQPNLARGVRLAMAMCVSLCALHCSFLGVSWAASRGKWRAQLVIAGVPTLLGFFESETEAALVYDNEAFVHGASLRHVCLSAFSSRAKVSRVFFYSVVVW